MRVLVACEFSGIVRDAFAARGHDAWSCDLLPTERPGPHYRGDIFDIIDGWMPVMFSADCDEDGNCPTCGIDFAECGHPGPTQDEMEYREHNGIIFARPEDSPAWDMMIAFPPCTYLCSSGLHWNKRRPGREELTHEAILFVFNLMGEGFISHGIPRVALENPIGCISTKYRKPDQIIQPWMFGEDASKATCLWLNGLPPLKPTNVISKSRYANQTPSGQNRLGPSPTRHMDRARTYPGIAAAMAEQWG